MTTLLSAVSDVLSQAITGAVSNILSKATCITGTNDRPPHHK